MSSTAKANVAAAQALHAGANPTTLELARKYMGQKNFIGYCQSFVRQVTGGRTTGASAIQAWTKAPQKVSGIMGIQPGDLVYFDANKSNRGYGHTGIYEGNGKFISATDNGIKSSDIFGWLKSTGQKLLGYVPGTNRAMGSGGQGSQQTNMAYVPPTPQQAIEHHVQMRKSGLESQVPVPTPPLPEDKQTINLDPNSVA